MRSERRRLERLAHAALTPGTRVRVRYLTQPTVEAVVVEEPDDWGWVKVEQDYEGGKVTFDAAIEYVELADG